MSFGRHQAGATAGVSCATMPGGIRWHALCPECQVSLCTYWLFWNVPYAEKIVIYNLSYILVKWWWYDFLVLFAIKKVHSFTSSKNNAIHSFKRNKQHNLTSQKVKVLLYFRKKINFPSFSECCTKVKAEFSFWLLMSIENGFRTAVVTYFHPFATLVEMKKTALLWPPIKGMY